MVVCRYNACFLVTKHSWKGKYKRIFCINQNEIATLNHQTFEETNLVRIWKSVLVEQACRDLSEFDLAVVVW